MRHFGFTSLSELQLSTATFTQPIKHGGSVLGNLCVTLAVLFGYASGAESQHFSFNVFLLRLQEVGSALGYGHFAAVVFIFFFF